MTPVENIEQVAVIGAGTVGASWALYFLASGLRVSIHDSDVAREAYVNDYIAQGWPLMRGVDSRLGATIPRADFQSSLDAALIHAQFVQESVPDNPQVKRAVFEALDRRLPANVVVASSTSSLLISELQENLATAHRFVVAHPFNPPHLIPVVEVVGGKATARATIDHTCGFFSRLGKTVLRLRKETLGHLVNRLQAALFQEAVALFNEGVASVADIDRGIALGPGLRWAAAGPFLTFHLGAGSGGIRSYLRHLGSAHERIWQDLKHVPGFSPELIERIADGINQEVGEATVDQLAAERDAALIALLNLASKRRFGR
jgi:carnitine 3-dehydrogenase